MTTVETMSLQGGAPCLDLVNTATNRTHGPLREKLRAYGDLVTLAERVGVLSPALGTALRAAADSSPKEAEMVLERARSLREVIYRVFAAREDSSTCTPGDLSLLSAAAAAAAAERRLVPDGDGYVFTWPDDPRPERVLWPLALSAAELLTSGDRARVKECAADHCDWLFLDLSRNRCRRWCDMAVCGNRAKARRFQKRRKG